MKLRRAKLTDTPQTADIWRSGWREGHLGGVPQELVAARTPEYFLKRAADRVSDTTVAIVDGAITGFIVVVDDEVEQVYVDAKFRGRGVARQLIDEAERQVALQGFREAWLAVVPSNSRARAFYEKAGWIDRGAFTYAAYSDAGPIAVTAHRYTKAVAERGLHGKVAVVAGATRGAGRGIAMALGEAGATVICTGRSSRTKSIPSDYGDRPETIEETAELVTELGGIGIPFVVDHLDPEQVEALAQQIAAEHGHIHLLVNDIWGGELLKGGPADWEKPIWEHDLEVGLRILRLALDTHLITAHHLLPLLIRKPGGLLVEVTDGTSEYNAKHYRISAYYDLAKVAINRLAFSLGHELKPHGGTAVCITPGWLRSEMMLEHYHVSEENWREAAEAPPDFALSESPRFVGRAVAALAADPHRESWNQQSVTSGRLAQEYNFTDLDGSQPDVWRYMTEVGETGREDARYQDYR